MAEADPETLLEWLSMGQGDERDMQVRIREHYFPFRPSDLFFAADCFGTVMYGSTHVGSR